MRRASVTVALSLAAVMTMTGLARRAVAADAEAAPAVTPFIDSGNDLPDLWAREREREKQAPLDRPNTVRGTWYGWQTLTVDLATTACFAGVRSSVCVLPYLATPAIHWEHGRPGLAGFSIGMRLGLPPLGGFVGAAIASCPDRHPSTVTTTYDGRTVTTTGWNLDLCGLHETAIGMMIGATVAAVLDAALGFARVPVSTGQEPTARRTPVIEPQLSLIRGGINLGVGGRF